MMQSPSPARFPRFRFVACLTAGCFGLVLAGCSMVEEAPPRPRTSGAAISAPVDVPPILQGTVAAEAGSDGFNNVVVEGYGLVVGLNGTGDRTQITSVRTHLLREMARRGIGSARHDSNINPEQMLSSPATAVVIVEGVVPAGSAEGATFDVRVRTLPGSDATSLEGGRLYTTELAPRMTSTGLPPVGSRQASPIATAKGAIFTNPFSEPGQAPAGTSGRILAGGATTKSMPVKLVLYTPSHNRAAVIEQAINLRFPREPGQPQKTARGESDSTIAITVPPSYQDRTNEFMSLLRHTSIQIGAMERSIQQINRLVTESPASADHASWRWQAFGRAVLPAIKKFYTYPEEAPRFAALRAGARLNDPLTAQPLLDLTMSGSEPIRVAAIDLLADLTAGPAVEVELAELLNADNIQVRLAAYEALAKRRSTHFVDRRVIDDKFIVDVVESDYPLVYVTQSDEPRIVLFGRNLSIDRPVTASAWSERFLMRGESNQEMVDVLYQEPASGATRRYRIEPIVRDFIAFLGHTETIESPEPGLGLTYSETISLVHQLVLDDDIPAEFMAEQDRILAAILARQAEIEEVADRPLFSGEDAAPTSPFSEPNAASDNETEEHSQ